MEKIIDFEVAEIIDKVKEGLATHIPVHFLDSSLNQHIDKEKEKTLMIIFKNYVIEIIDNN